MREIGIQPDILLLPHRRCRSRRRSRRRSRSSRTCGRGGHLRHRRRSASTRCRSTSTRKGSTSSSPSGSTSGAASRTSERGSASSSASRSRRTRQVKIGIVGKYVHLKDAYKSLHEALVHGGARERLLVELEYIDSEQIERAGAARRSSRGSTRVLVPGGFGDRGHRGEDRGDRLRARERDPVLRHLPRHAARGRRVRASRRGARAARTRASSTRTRPTRSST